VICGIPSLSTGERAKFSDDGRVEYSKLIDSRTMKRFAKDVNIIEVYSYNEDSRVRLNLWKNSVSSDLNNGIERAAKF
jgi:hypothetical protein